MRLLAVLLALLFAPALALAQESAVFSSPPRVERLPNGLTVISLRTDAPGIIAYYTLVRVGSRDEVEPGHSGYAHLFEHMMFRGTERYPAHVYNRVITTIGADANAYTTDDHTAYHIAMAAEDLEQVIELESDRFQHLSYAEDAFQTEAGAVYGEYRKTRMEPEFALYEELVGTAFERHPYGHTTMGYERDIAIMPTLYDYSREFFGRYYRPENTVLFVAGDVAPSKVFPLVERHYGGWQRGYVAPQIPVEPEQRAERRVDVAYDGQTLPLVLVAYKLPLYDAANPTRVAADLFADLAFGETSEAYRRLVLDEQVAEDLDAGASYNRDPGLLEISAHVKDPSKVEYVLDVIDETVAKFQAEPPDSGRLADLKRRLRYGFLMGLQTPDAVAARVAQFIALNGDLTGLDRLHATYAAVAPDDVLAAAKNYLRAERRTVGMLRSRS